MAIQRKGVARKPHIIKEGENVQLKQDKSDLGGFSVDKGIPMPTKFERDSLVGKFPLTSMEVGDSFLVKKPHNRQVQNSISCSIRQFCNSKKIKHKYSVFKDPNTDYIRVWRSH